MIKNESVYFPGGSTGNKRRSFMLGVVIVLVLLVGIVIRLVETIASSTAPTHASIDNRELIVAELSALRDKLNREIAIRQNLDHELVVLKKQVETLTQTVKHAQRGHPISAQQTYAADKNVDGARAKFANEGAGSRADLYSQRTATPSAGASDETEDAGGGNTSAFDGKKLIQAGLTTADASYLRQRWQDVEMSKLSVNDQAAREGWFNTRRHHEILDELDQTIRAELGEKSYDSYLYASHKPNRVVIRDVFDQSLTADGLLLPGDTILRYDGQRIFSSSDLRSGMINGPQSDDVLMEIQRGETRFFVQVPRQPLGILTGLKVQAPLLE